MRAHVIAFKAPEPQQLAAVFPCSLARVPECITVVFVSPAQTYQQLEALARRVPALMVRGKVVAAWARHLAALYPSARLDEAAVQEWERQPPTAVADALARRAVCTQTQGEASTLLRTLRAEQEGYARARLLCGLDRDASVAVRQLLLAHNFKAAATKLLRHHDGAPTKEAVTQMQVLTDHERALTAEANASGSTRPLSRPPAGAPLPPGSLFVVHEPQALSPVQREHGSDVQQRSNCLFGRVDAFFFKFEMNQRGELHVHGCIWQPGLQPARLRKALADPRSCPDVLDFLESVQTQWFASPLLFSGGERPVHAQKLSTEQLQEVAEAAGSERLTELQRDVLREVLVEVKARGAMEDAAVSCRPPLQCSSLTEAERLGLFAAHAVLETLLHAHRDGTWSVRAGVTVQLRGFATGREP
eukprot:XP_001692845.1 predicted protein [Chlamydomonas reinhardtii]